MLGFDQVCKEKFVSICARIIPGRFDVEKDSGKVIKYPIKPFVGFNPVALEWEIQDVFFKVHNIKPTFYTCTEVGSYWRIFYDRMEYALYGFGHSWAGSRLASYTPPTQYLKNYWLTRYPRELSPTWNLLGLFTMG